MSATPSVLDQYLDFCQSPLRTRQSIRDEYQQLLRNPDVTHVAFHKPHVLMVGTRSVIISCEDKEYEIGQFILFLIRKRTGREWETSFRFSNCTHPISLLDKAGNEYVAMHPHIVWWSDDVHMEGDIDFRAGELCIASGQLPIYQALRKGYINTAVSHLMVVLRTYGTGQPFHFVNEWPFVVKESDHA